MSRTSLVSDCSVESSGKSSVIRIYKVFKNETIFLPFFSVTVRSTNLLECGIYFLILHRKSRLYLEQITAETVLAWMKRKTMFVHDIQNPNLGSLLEIETFKMAANHTSDFDRFQMIYNNCYT